MVTKRQVYVGPMHHSPAAATVLSSTTGPSALHIVPRKGLSDKRAHWLTTCPKEGNSVVAFIRQSLLCVGPGQTSSELTSLQFLPLLCPVLLPPFHPSVITSIINIPQPCFQRTKLPTKENEDMESGEPGYVIYE